MKAEAFAELLTSVRHQRAQIENALMRHAAALDAGNVAAEVNFIVVRQPRGDVVRRQDGCFRGRPQACAPIMRMYIQLIGKTDALPSGAADIAPTCDAMPMPAVRCAGRYGTRSATTHTGPTPGPPPPCGMQKVLCRLR